MVPISFSTFPFVFSGICVDATVPVFQGVRATVTSSPGQSQAIPSLRAGLLGPSLSPLPDQHSHHSPPMHSSSGLHSTDPWPQSWGSMPSVCQRGYYFSTPEIQARWMLHLVWGMAPLWSLARTRGKLGVLFQTPCCLFRGWWSYSPRRQWRFSSQPRPDNVSWLMFFTLSGERIEATTRAAPTTLVSSPDITLTPSTGHSTPNPPFFLTLLHTYKLTHRHRHTRMRFSTSETGLKQNDFMLLVY